MEYTDAHRLFLQILTARRVLTGSDVKLAYQKSCEKYNVNSESLQSFVLQINNQLGVMNLIITKCIQEEEEKDVQCFVLINSLNSDPLKTLNTYNAHEREYIKKLVETIVLSGEGYITEIEAINLGLELERNMLAGDCENLLIRLGQGKWVLNINSHIYLSGLTIAEMTSYLEDNCGITCNKCVFCKSVTLRGHFCQGCEKWFHRSCAKQYWKRTKTPGRICPECSLEWEEVSNKRVRTSFSLND